MLLWLVLLNIDLHLHLHLLLHQIHQNPLHQLQHIQQKVDLMHHHSVLLGLQKCQNL